MALARLASIPNGINKTRLERAIVINNSPLTNKELAQRGGVDPGYVLGSNRHKTNVGVVINQTYTTGALAGRR